MGENFLRKIFIAAVFLWSVPGVCGPEEGRHAAISCSRWYAGISGKPLDRDRLVNEFIADPAVAGRLFSEADAKALGILDQYQKLSAQLERAGPEFSVLMSDPRVLAHLHEVNEVLSSGGGFSSPENLIRAAREKLGYREVYRGLTLTDDQLEKIKMEGVYAPRSVASEGDIRTHEYAIPFVVEPSDGVSPVSLDNYLAGTRYHVMGFSTASNFMSVSDHAEIASSVASSKSKGRAQLVYLVKIKISNFDLISKNPGSFPSTVNERRRLVVAGFRNGARKEYSTGDESVERFVFLKINPEEIESIEALPIGQAGSYRVQ